MNDVQIEIQRASILSGQRVPTKETDELAPTDRYWLTHIVFYFIGLVSLLSIPFFITANDYWMYKFRDVSQPDYNASNKTDLQRYFVSASSITNSISGLITTVLTALYGHKLHIKLRLWGSLISLVFIYLIFTCFILINTDEWQTVFFYTTMAGYIIITVSTNLLIAINYNLISRFPQEYMKTQFYGQGTGGILSGLLQIISLAAVNDTTSAALIYFLSGTFIIILTVVLGILGFKLEFFNYYLGDTVADTQRPVYSVADIKIAVKRTWPCLFMFFGMLFTACAQHPNITSLVVSEYYSTKNAWSVKYFVPVATYLSTEIYNLLGRILARPIVTPKNWLYFVAIYTIRTVIAFPIFMLCNAQPRSHLPVLFPHDWEYMLIVFLINFSMNYMVTCGMLSIPMLAKDKTEVAFLFMMSVASCLNVISSLLSPVFVSLL